VKTISVDNKRLAWFAFLKDLGLFGSLILIIINEENIKKEKSN